MTRVLSVLLLALTVAVCDDGHLRGSLAPSRDGETYLAVMDDNGGRCGPIKVDGAVWPFKIGEASRIIPGVHRIECGTEISLEIPNGVLFQFDYWGP
jgi:hypothetical protein